jgi:transcriptional regulator with XRE-family HTH domain
MDEKPAVNRLKRRRQDLGLTQDELGAKAGLDRSSVCRIEKGFLTPPDAKKKSLARALGWSTSHLAKVLAEISQREEASHAA